jgi:hypothetical protein
VGWRPATGPGLAAGPRAINDSYAFLACFSALSLARSRSYAYPKIDEAIKIQRTLRHDSPFIVPVRLTECEIPATPIDANRTLQSLQRFDYYGRNKRLPDLVRVLDAARHGREGGLSSAPPGVATR